MKNGDKVICKNEKYTVFFVYESGYCEIKSVKYPYKMELVKLEDLMLA